jgi:hypothetical protein
MWNTILNGLKYAFFGNGGFNVEKGFQQVYILKMDELDKYDVTNSIQVSFDVRTFNEKLGLFKNANNNGLISSTYNYESDSFNVDNVSLSALEFISGISPSSIISLGSLTSLYSDFTYYLNQYFNNKSGFTDTFTLARPININNGIFDASAFMYLLHRHARDCSGNFVTDLSGTVTFNDINNTLREVVCMNIFNNRDMSGGDSSGVDVSGTAIDPTNPYNYTVADGFVEGDLLFIPNGITITLTINISNNNVVLNESGNIFLGNLNLQTNYTHGYFSQYTETTPTNITRIVTTPLLIKLQNKSVSKFKYTDRINKLIQLEKTRRQECEIHERHEPHDDICERPERNRHHHHCETRHNKPNKCEDTERNRHHHHCETRHNKTNKCEDTERSERLDKLDGLLKLVKMTGVDSLEDLLDIDSD